MTELAAKIITAVCIGTLLAFVLWSSAYLFMRYQSKKREQQKTIK